MRGVLFFMLLDERMNALMDRTIMRLRQTSFLRLGSTAVYIGFPVGWLRPQRTMQLCPIPPKGVGENPSEKPKPTPLGSYAQQP